LALPDLNSSVGHYFGLEVDSVVIMQIEDACTVLSLAIDGFRRPQITARSVSALEPQLAGSSQVYAAALGHRASRASKTSVCEDDSGEP
jgi:hypothetical protein